LRGGISLQEIKRLAVQDFLKKQTAALPLGYPAVILVPGLMSSL
jgi:hypothetical protein